jgi:sulfur carrier protein ThiS
MSVEFTLNGETGDMPKGARVIDLVVELELQTLPLNIKINNKRLMRKEWQQEIQGGDRIEIGQLVPQSCVTVPY